MSYGWKLSNREEILCCVVIERGFLLELPFLVDGNACDCHLREFVYKQVCAVFMKNKDMNRVCVYWDLTVFYVSRYPLGGVFGAKEPLHNLGIVGVPAIEITLVLPRQQNPNTMFSELIGVVRFRWGFSRLLKLLLRAKKLLCVERWPGSPFLERRISFRGIWGMCRRLHLEHFARLVVALSEACLLICFRPILDFQFHTWQSRSNLLVHRPMPELVRWVYCGFESSTSMRRSFGKSSNYIPTIRELQEIDSGVPSDAYF